VKRFARTILLCVGALIATGLIRGVWVITQFNRPPFDLVLLERLHLGMPASEVQQILGAPEAVFPEEREWAYSHPQAWPIVYVYFDEQWCFQRHRYDH
jgi:hypothetical protein